MIDENGVSHYLISKTFNIITDVIALILIGALILWYILADDTFDFI